MNTPLSVLLPVYNAQQRLARGINEILDALPVWAERFELIIVDDGSTDDTADVALELAARFPQIRVVRHPVRLGLSEAVQTGLDEADAEVILVGNDTYELDLDDLRALWQVRDAQRERTQRGESSTARRVDMDGSGMSLTRLAQQLGFQMIERATFDQLRLAHAADAIGRIDSIGAAMSSEGTMAPNFLERVKRLALGH